MSDGDEGKFKLIESFVEKSGVWVLVSLIREFLGELVVEVSKTKEIINSHPVGSDRQLRLCSVSQELHSCALKFTFLCLL